MVTATSIGTGGLGRFGNQLYTIAGVIGIALRSGQPFGFPEWRNYDNALFGGSVDNMGDYFENKLPPLPEGIEFNEYGYFWGYRDLFLPVGNWSINAHLQSPKFFEDRIDAVRHYFTLVDEPEENDYCCVHFRAGDYIDDPRAYHPRCSKEYYEKAKSFIPDGTKFLVFSDDIEKAKEVFNGAEYMNGNYIEDFKLMKKCKHFIIANSTFSSMAATLADQEGKVVVAPKRWFGEQANGMNWDDGYEKNWIVI